MWLRSLVEVAGGARQRVAGGPAIVGDGGVDEKEELVGERGE